MIAKFRISIYLFLLLSISALNAQFEAIDVHAKNVPNHLRYDIDKLTEYLIKPANSELEKVRAFYVWLAENISYDVKEYKKIVSGKFGDTIYSEDFDEYELNTMKQAMVNKKAVCHGYSLIFNAMCNNAGIESRIISGNSKNDSESSIQRIGDHSWNAAKVDGQWRLFDATWGSGRINNGRYEKYFNELYFNSKPEKLIFNHLPADPMWQMLPNPISYNVFIEDKSTIKNALAILSQNPFAYTDSIAKLYTYPAKIRDLISAENAFKFNPRNTTDLGFAWNNHAVRISKKVLSMNASDAPIDDVITLNEEAILAQKKSLDYIDDPIIKEGLGIFYINQAKFYQDKGNATAESGNYLTAINSYNSSLEFIDKARPYFNKQNLTLEAEGTSLLNLGFVYSNLTVQTNDKKENYNKALNYLERAKTILKQANTGMAKQNLRVVEQNLASLKSNRRALGF